jgi:hypothetical protein
MVSSSCRLAVCHAAYGLDRGIGFEAGKAEREHREV